MLLRHVYRNTVVVVAVVAKSSRLSLYPRAESKCTCGCVDTMYVYLYTDDTWICSLCPFTPTHAGSDRKQWAFRIYLLGGGYRGRAARLWRRGWGAAVVGAWRAWHGLVVYTFDMQQIRNHPQEEHIHHV